MTLRPSETRELFAQECSFPIGREGVLEAVGNVTITSQNGDGTDIETVLNRGDETTYASVEELHNTVMANLDDDHIGRKHYDDRSSAKAQDDELSF